MKTNVIAFPLLGLVSLLNFPVTTHAATAPLPFTEMGAIATADYKGDAIGIHATGDGARLNTAFQKLSGTVTRDGLWLDSTEGQGGGLRLVASAIGRNGRGTPLSSTGTVTVGEKLVTFARPGLTEEYSVSVDGLRQDFVVAERPPGTGDLRVELAVTGAKAESAKDGARLVLDGSGRKLAYNRLHVTDASGKPLAATLKNVSVGRLAIEVADAYAAYPVRIDPVFNDANWVSLSSGMSSNVYALALGTNGILYAGGTFTTSGGMPATNVAKWNGTAWSALGSGVGGQVNVLVLDTNGNLYAGVYLGSFSTTFFAKLTGTNWSFPDQGFPGSTASGNALAVDTNGNVYVGGSLDLENFATGQGFPYNTLIWNGTALSALGSDVGGQVNALAFDSFGNLYAGGSFTTAGGVSANNIAKWNGTAWSALGSGIGGPVSALAFDSLGNLYAGGSFTSAGGVSANHIAEWNGSTWLAVGLAGMNAQVKALAFDSSGDLYAAGGFSTAGGITVNYIAEAIPGAGIVVEQPIGTYLVSGTATNDFGTLNPGGSYTLTFTVQDTGYRNLTLGAITMDGANPGDFAVNTNGMLTTLLPDSNTTFTVTFAPKTNGLRTAAIHIASNGSNASPFTINLAGAGNQPGAQTLAASGVTNNQATINGSLTTGGLDTSAYFQIGYTTNYVADTPTMSFAGTNMATLSVSNQIANLAPGTLYHFQLVASNAAGTVLGGDRVFTTLAGYPEGLTLAASGVTATNATLNGELTTGHVITTAYFQYGLTTNYGSYTATITRPGGDTVLLVSNLIANLAPGTLYHFELVVSNAAGTVLAGDLTFMTQAAPTVTTLAASAVTPTNAMLSGTVIPNGAATTAYFQYGLTTNYGSYSATNILAATNTAFSVTNLISGLSPGTTYHFQIVGTNNVGTSLGSDLTFTTGAAAPTVATLAATGVTAANATLNGTVNPNGAATTAYFQYGLTTNYGSYSATNILAATNTTLSVTNLITGLTPGTTYHFRIVGTNNVGTSLGSDLTFTTGAAAPTVATLAATGVTAANATLNGTVNPNGAATTAYFQYGLTTNYGSYSATNILAATNTAFSITNVISGLSPGTTYHFRIVGTNNVGTSLGSDLTFTTGAAAPTVATLAATGVTATNATLNGTVNPNGAGTKAYFQYGLTTSYGSYSATNTLAATNTTLSVSNLVSGLSPGTTYHFRIVGTNNVGTSLGSDLTFATSAAAPAVTTLAATGVTATNATLNGTVSPNGAATKAYFQYGLTTSYGSYSATNTLAATNTTLSVSNLVSGLSPGTTYHFRIVGTNNVGTSLGSDMTFTTGAAAPTAATLAATGVGATNATLSGTVNPNGAATKAYFQYGLTTSYGSYSATNSLAATNTSLSVSNLISGLTAGTAYHFRVVGSNSIGVSLGGDLTFTTASSQPAAFNLHGSIQLASGAFRLSFTNLSGLSFTVLGTTNLALASSNWTVLGSPTEAPPGQYQFTDSQATNNSQRFYRVRSP